MSKKPHMRTNNYLLVDGVFTKISRRLAIGIFDRQDNLLRIGSYEDYQLYWRDDITQAQYEARKLEPEVPYGFWVYEPIKEVKHDPYLS